MALIEQQRYYRRVIRIVAEDSPNVAFALEQRNRGIEPDGRVLVPGVLSWADYCKRLALWDEAQKSVSLWARFYEGPELKLFPPEWLQRALQAAQSLAGKPRKARAVGIDPAEGGDGTSMAAVDEMGLIELITEKTKDTSVIPRRALAFASKWGCAPENIVFDRGGGGTQAADLLRSMSYAVRTVAFGETIVFEPLRTGIKRPFDERLEQKEERYVFLNRRAQMYGEASMLLDPSGIGASLLPGLRAFALPARYCSNPLLPGRTSLVFQLSKFPKNYDQEGRLKLPPKQKRNPDSKEITLIDLIGHSPDEGDAFVLAVHGMLHRKRVMAAGAG